MDEQQGTGKTVVRQPQDKLKFRERLGGSWPTVRVWVETHWGVVLSSAAVGLMTGVLGIIFTGPIGVLIGLAGTLLTLVFGVARTRHRVHDRR